MYVQYENVLEHAQLPDLVLKFFLNDSCNAMYLTYHCFQEKELWSLDVHIDYHCVHHKGQISNLNKYFLIIFLSTNIVVSRLKLGHMVKSLINEKRCWPSRTTFEILFLWKSVLTEFILDRKLCELFTGIT